MKASPLVSIIINCYNGEKFLKECLDSIVAQTYKNWEIIFWDNISNDNSKDILKKYYNYNIKYFKSEIFLNLYHARNLAIKQASGKYIFFLDTDDFWEIEKIETQVNFLENNKVYQMVYSNYYSYDHSKNKKFIQNKFNLPNGKITKKILKKYSIGILTVCLKKEIFEKQSFNNKYEIIGDFDFFTKLSKKIEIGCIQKPLANYRIHDSNYSKKKRDLYIQELNEWIEENEIDFNKNGITLFYQKVLLLKLKIKNFFSFLGV